jgi:hypothetical protein
MACCGDRRRSLSQPPKSPTPASAPVVRTQSVASRPPAVQQPQIQMQAAAAPMLLRYAGNAKLVIPGPVTGKRYLFSGRESIQSVDARDALALLRRSDFDRG